MNEITIFKNDEFGQVRTIGSEFVAADVARVLGYSDASAMTRTLDDDEKGMQIVQTPGGDQKLITINESGLYHAVLKSRVPKAKTFRKWVTSEVLPAIRKTGGYANTADPAESLSQIATTFADYIRSQQLVNQVMLETLRALREDTNVSRIAPRVIPEKTANGKPLFIVEVSIVPAGVRVVTDFLDRQAVGYTKHSELRGSCQVLVIDGPVEYWLVDALKTVIRGFTSVSKWARIKTIQL